MDSTDVINNLFYVAEAPEWAQYISVSTTGDCFWWKSKPIADTAGVWHSSDNIYKKIPEDKAHAPNLAGSVVARMPQSTTGENKQRCPHCGHELNSQPNNGRDESMRYETEFKLNKKLYEDIQAYLAGNLTVSEAFGHTGLRTLACEHFGEYRLYVSLLGSAIAVDLIDIRGVSVAGTCEMIAEMPGYDFTGEYVLHYNGNKYTAVVSLTDEEKDDFNAVLYASLVAQTPKSFTGLDSFEVPSDEDCSVFRATGSWAVTLAVDVEQVFEHCVQYELLVSILKDEDDEGNVEYANTLCESIIISDGKNFNKLIPSQFLEQDGEDPVDPPKQGDSIRILTIQGDHPILINLTRI